MNCICCNRKLTPCYNGDHQLRAWWCQHCGYTDKAIGRERRFTSRNLGNGTGENKRKA